MELFWYIVLTGMLATYIILDGYDFGAGIIHLFFAKTEADKKAITSAIGPFWDANEVWLIASGAIMFFAFPTLYASAFSGFYLPLMIILWLLIFRAIGLELRGQVHNKLWEAVWDKSFGLASLLLALFFGVALGNVVRGVNLGIVENGLSSQEAIYFFLPLWDSSLSPSATHLGIIDWFTLLLGIISVLSLTIHGANWLILKTNATINTRLRNTVFIINILLSLLIIVSLLAWNSIVDQPFQNFTEHPWLWIFPLIMLAGNIGLYKVRSFKKEGLGFLFSSLFLAGGLVFTAVSMFPVVLPSSNPINPSLTIYNTSADAYGLEVGIYWFAVAIVLVIAYTIIQHKVFKGKMDDVGYGEH